MLDEDKIRVMTKLAVFDKEKGTQAEIASRYYKNDYISYHMIWTAIFVTFAYLFIIGLLVFCRMEYYINHLQELNIVTVAVSVGTVYICFLIMMEVIAFIIYRGRYRRAVKYLKEYCRNLKELEKIYNKEHLRQTRATADIKRSLNMGGMEPHD